MAGRLQATEGGGEQCGSGRWKMYVGGDTALSLAASKHPEVQHGTNTFAGRKDGLNIQQFLQRCKSERLLKILLTLVFDRLKDIEGMCRCINCMRNYKNRDLLSAIAATPKDLEVGIKVCISQRAQTLTEHVAHPCGKPLRGVQMCVVENGATWYTMWSGIAKGTRGKD